MVCVIGDLYLPEFMICNCVQQQQAVCPIDLSLFIRALKIKPRIQLFKANNMIGVGDAVRTKSSCCFQRMKTQNESIVSLRLEKKNYKLSEFASKEIFVNIY